MDNDHLQLWAIDHSEYLVEEKFLKLRVDSCTTPQGAQVEKYFVLEYDDWVNCLVIDANNDAILVKHYRHGARTYITEFVSGGVEPTDASPEIGIRRELEEELGYTGGELYQVGVSYPNSASQTNKVYSFLAIGGNITKDQDLEPGESLLIEKIPFATLLKQFSSSDIPHQSLHIATLFFAIEFIRKSPTPSAQSLKQFV
jgi:8-oxo-dGTP pyrophosphatase MutT (NUDIX family)